MFQSPTEQCSHSDDHSGADPRQQDPSFNLLRSSAVIQTSVGPCGPAGWQSFNLLRSSAVIQTLTTIFDSVLSGSFNLLRSSAVIQTTKRPNVTGAAIRCFNLLRSSAVIQTARCWSENHKVRQVSISYGAVQSFRHPVRGVGIVAHLVSISYGAVQSFRLHLATGKYTTQHKFQSPTEQCSHSDENLSQPEQSLAMVFQSPTEQCSHSDSVSVKPARRNTSSFNLLRSSAVIQTAWDQTAPHADTRFNLLRSSAVIQTHIICLYS